MNMPPISIRAVFRGATLAVVLLVLALLAVAARIGDTQRAMVAASQQHFDSEHTADELRDSSNQLTQMARLYVDTGDRRYLGYYNDILAIRNGQAPRPPEYGSVYWDLVMAGRHHHPSGGQTQSFVSRLVALGFSADEFALLREAQQQSDDLVNLEREAFAAMEGRFLDANGTLTRAGPPDRDYARSLLNGSRYLEAKARVMAPISEFEARVMQRVGDRDSQLAAQQAFQITLALSLLALTLITVAGTYAYVSRNILRPIQALDHQARAIADSDYSARNDVAVRNELGELGRALNLASTAAQSDLEARTRFKTIFDNATDGILLVNMENYKLLFGNAAICRMLGYAPGEIEGLRVQDIHPEKDRPYVMREFDRGEAGASENFSVKRKDGSVFYADITVAYFEFGGKRYQAGFFRDITERKQMEQLLREREAELTAIVENSPIAMIVSVGADEKVMVMNQKFTELLGYTLDDVPDIRHWWALAYPDEKYREEVEAEWTRRVERAIQSQGKIEPMEATVTCKDGSTRFMRFHFASVGGRHIITFDDLTVRKNMETALRESEARYRGIFDAVDDLIYTLEADGTFSSLSPSFERMTGWLPEEWIGKHFTPLTHPDDLPRAQELFESLLSGEAVPPFDLRLITKAGTYLDTEIKSVAIRHGDSITIFGVLRDITARKRVEEKIRQLNDELEIKVHQRTRQLLEAQDELVRKEKLSMLGQVAGTVGHELRNPLGVISNAVYFLQTVLSDSDETTREYLGIIKNEVTAADRIVGDLLDSVRIKPPQPETVGMAQLIEQTMGKCTIPTSVTVKLDTPESLPPLWVDSMQIRQVLRNLVNNGVEAMPAGGTLKIRAAAGAGAKNVTVRVTDNGIGMTPEQLGKLFQPLLTTKARGIGLGLMVVKNLTEANGGRVAVESAPGVGSTFAVTLPADGTEMQPEGSGA